jgi:dual specificity phosphatase 12
MNKKWNTERIAKHEPRREQTVREPQEATPKAKPVNRKPKTFTRSQKTPKEIELLKQRKGELISQEEDSEEEDEDQLLSQLADQRRKEEEEMEGDDLIKIENGLYIGHAKQARNPKLLDRFEITHVLTILKDVTRKDVLREKEGEEHILHKIIEIEDYDNEDFASRFDECADFINDALQQQSNNILIHDDDRLMASRSSTAILAYYIREKRLTVEEGLQILLDRAPNVEPNEGFKRQLNRYYVKQRRIQREESEKQQQERPQQLTSQELKQQRIQEINQQKEQTEEPASDQDKQAYCKRCRHVLFSTQDLVSHSADTEGAGMKGFSFKKLKKDSTNKSNGVTCNSLFINRMDWMGELLDQEGKLICPECAGRVGSYSWIGSQCSCGMWMNPSFAVLKTRVD